MKYFGTDGVRGRFGHYPVDEKFFSKLAYVLEEYFGGDRVGGNFTVCVGTDTRESSGLLFDAFIRGFSKKTKVLNCGILPTPAIALATVSSRANFGAMITASHNPYYDNGIKIFNANGEKLTQAQEEQIEHLLAYKKSVAQQGSSVTDFHETAKIHYCERYKNFLPAGSLIGHKIMLDSANGAAAEVAKSVFESFGAEVTQIGNSPDGRNINAECGSEYPHILSRKMSGMQALIGVANDGDGDRAVILNELGDVVDGNILLGILAKNMLDSGELPNKTIVTTFQSNLGLDEYFKSIGGKVLRCGIGDREVYQTMIQNDCAFGGESSGHFIFRKFCPIGDGIAAALYLIRILIFGKGKFSSLGSDICLFPQSKFNVTVDKKIPINQIGQLRNDIEALESELPSPRRIFYRYSGTEPKLRVLIETIDKNILKEACEKLKRIILNNMLASGIEASI